MSKNKKKLEKKNWSSTFMLIGKAKITDYTFKIDKKSERSDWNYNQLNLGVDCGEKHGVVYADMMGGYGLERDNILYVHGKKEDGNDDFTNRFTIDWDDRFDETILESIGEFKFLTVGIEKQESDKTYYKKFLSEYDAISYVKEHLKEDMVINVKGDLKYSVYNDNVQVKKEIRSIVLSKADDPSKYAAKFTQTMLLTKDSVGAVNKEKGAIPIRAKVLDYVKEWNGKTVKTFIPYNKTFEYELDLTDKERVKKVISKVFKVQRGVTEVTFTGDLIEGGAVVQVTEDDLTDDIKTLIEIGVYTLDEALKQCTDNSGGKERRMVIRKPVIKLVDNEDGTKIPVIQKFDRKYEEEDLILDFMYETEEDEDEEVELPIGVEDDIEEVSSDDDSWLDDL